MKVRKFVHALTLAFTLAGLVILAGIATHSAQAQDPEKEPAACSAPFKSKWLLKGNCATNGANHFLGTLDNQPLVLKTNAEERMRIDAAGNVGIGTSTPARKLHVKGTSTQVLLESTSNQTWTNLQYKTDAREWHAGVGGSAVSNDVKNKYYIFDATASQFRLAIHPNGNVGIGTTNPGSRLSVTGVVESTTGGFKFPDGTTQTTAAAAAGTFVKKSGDTMTGALTLPNNGLTVGGNQLVVSGPNVGMGTASPGRSLHVSGANSGIRLQSTNSQVWTTTEYQTDNRLWHTGVGGSAVSNSVKGKYYIFDGTAGQFRLIIDTNGNIGIGTTDRLPKMVVRGWGNSEGSQSFQAENVNGDMGLMVNDNRTVRIGTTKGTSSTHTCYAAANDLTFATCYGASAYVPSVDMGLGFPETGELVSIAAMKNPYNDPRNPFAVQKTAAPCDSNLLGIISDPAAGADGDRVNEHYLPLALSGVHPVQVSVENGLIRRGDPLTSSSRPGYAAKAADACKTIGYALEDAYTDGTIRVLAQPGEHSAAQVAQLREQMDALQQANQLLVQENRQMKTDNVRLASKLTAIEARLDALEASDLAQAGSFSARGVEIGLWR